MTDTKLPKKGGNDRNNHPIAEKLNWFFRQIAFAFEPLGTPEKMIGRGLIYESTAFALNKLGWANLPELTQIPLEILKIFT